MKQFWKAAVATLGLAVAVAMTGQSAYAAPVAGTDTPTTMNAAFARAATAYGVPRDLLVAVGYGETHLDGHDGKPSSANGYGVMHLVSNPRRHTLERAAKLTGESVATLKSDTTANIRGGAALLRAYADQLGLRDRGRLASWYPVVAAYGGAQHPETARIYADTVYELLNSGIDTRVAGERVVVPRRHVDPDRGRYANAAPPGTGSSGEGEIGIQSTDYPPAHWVPANSANYSVGRSAAISYVIIHVTQGSYAGTINWFQNPAAQVSAHYVVRSSDGDITQMVRDADTAYHVRSWNPSSLGIEHEGYVDDPSWFTDAMYRSSAALTRHLCTQHGIPMDRSHILGHNELSDNDHTDPGPYWNWDYYMQLVTSGGKGMYGGSPTDFNGDGKDDIVTFTQGTAGDVYAATSSGTAFDGTTAKWHEAFALAGETPLTGDFDGDGKDDIVTFTQGATGDVYVALSNGTGFGAGVKWHDFFSPAGEVPAVGDVNGDGKDDIVTFTNNAAGDVFVALSDGTAFGAGVKWHDWFAPNGEFPAVGDVNGDGKDDVVTFTRGSNADVYVALSDGASFGAGAKWNDWFAVGGEQPRVADVTGDGKADIVTFTNDSLGDVYVGASDGASFGGGAKWHDWFAPNGEFPYVGDFDGDGKADIVTFTKNSDADVYVALSTATAFGAGTKWHDFFGLPGETTL
jgi:hypothetical protein